MHALLPMDQSDTRAVTIEFQGCDSSRVLAAHNYNVEVVERMRLLVVVQHLREIFSRTSQIVRQIVVAGRNRNLARAIDLRVAVSVAGGDRELAVLPADLLHHL